MLEIKQQKSIFKIKEFWFSEYPFDVNGCHMVTFMDCKNNVEADGFEIEEFTTLVIDLTRDLDEIWENMNSSCRYKINRVKRDGIKIKINDNYEEFYALNRSFRKNKRLPEDNMEIDLMKKCGSLFVAEYKGEIIAGQFYLQDGNNIRLLLGASKRLEVDKERTALIGRANRLITWEAINYAKSKGVKEFDMGGYHTGKTKDEQREKINFFKESFGGKLVTHYIYHKYYSKTFKYTRRLYQLRLGVKSYLYKIKILLTDSIKRIVLASMYILKVHELFRFLNRKKVVVIMYHGVVERELSPFAWTQMPLQKFEQQIEYISKKYHILPLTTVVEKLINKEKLPEYSLAITFDDGLKNNYTTTFPILKRFNLPAAIFLTTCNINSNKLLWFDNLYLAIKETKKTSIDLKEDGLDVFPIATPNEKNRALSTLFNHIKRLQRSEKDLFLDKVLNKLNADSIEGQDATPFKSLDWDDIISLQQSNLISFGAHTETHNIMTRLTKEEVLQEIEISKKNIEEKLRIKCQLFAFPNGQKEDFNNEIKDAVKNSGFLCSFTTIGKFNEYCTDPYELGRFPIGSNFDKQYFALLISGATGFLSKIADRFISR